MLFGDPLRLDKVIKLFLSLDAFSRKCWLTFIFDLVSEQEEEDSINLNELARGTHLFVGVPPCLEFVFFEVVAMPDELQ